MADNISDSVDDIGKGIEDFSKSTAQGKAAASKITSAYLDFTRAASATGSAFYDANAKFAKFEKSIDYTSKFLDNAARNIPGVGGAIGSIVRTISTLTEMVFEQNDLQLTAFDRVSKFGAAAGLTTEKLSTITHESNTSVKNNESFLKSIEDSNTGLINLGKTTSEGIGELSQITKTDAIVDEFMRLGQNQDSLRMMQTKYIKMQETLGFGLEKGAKNTRQSSLDYVTSLVGLSAITGHNVDELADQMAAQANDLKFNIKLRELNRAGNDKAIKNFKEAATISASMLSPQTAAGVRDFLSNGVATTKEGEALLSITGGEVSTWAAQLESGQIDALEFNKRVAKAKIDYEQTNRKSLQISKDYREQVGVSVKDLDGAQKIMNAQNLADIKSQVENAKKQKDIDGKIKSGLKETQIDAAKTERQSSITYEKTIGVVSGPVNNVFRILADLVKQTAIGSIKLGNWLSGGTNKELEAALAILGDDKDIKGVNQAIKKSLTETDKQISMQRDEGVKTKAAKDAYDKAIQAKKAAKSPEEKKKADTDIAAADKALQEQRKNEKEKYGTDTLTLEQKRQELLDRQARTQEREKNKKAEKRKQSISGGAAEVSGSFLEFKAGNSNDATHFGQLDPAFGSTVSALAERYYNLSGGKRLSINSSYRSQEEQEAIYKAWVKAGGSKDKPFAGGYYMPSAGGSAHSKGKAVDIDAAQLDFLESKGVLEEFGLHRPHKDRDPVHVVPKAKLGGMFDGPNSGYAALLHGTEAKIPLKNGTISIDMNNKSLSGFTDGKSELSSAGSSSSGSSAPVQEAGQQSTDTLFTDILLAKLDDLNTKVEESNRIYSDIKLYAHN
jgi:hypothetical protein